MDSTRKRFIFLVLEEHPFGRHMLRRLLDADLVPEAILEERSRIGAVERDKFLQRLGPHPAGPSIAELAAARGVPTQGVPKHSDEHCLEPIRSLAPDLIVLGGTRIIRGQLLTAAPDGILNSHPGLLPECRGSASPAWSIYHDIPLGSSCHFCTAAIDEGDLVGRRELPVRRGETYEDLCYRTLIEAGRLMCEAVSAWREGRLDDLRRPQGSSPHPTFKNMPDELLEVVRRKLSHQTYAHYVD